MRVALLFITIILFLFTSAYGMESDWRLTMAGEHLVDDADSGSVASLGIYTGGIFYGGLSLNYITSAEVIQHDDRKEIYPLFVVMGLRAPWKISPYVEGGLDLPEALLDELLDDEENSLDFTDYFYAGGLEFAATEQLSFSVYAKRYRFKFRDNILSPVTRVGLNAYGLAASLRF